jgi:hypothetical protein
MTPDADEINDEIAERIARRKRDAARRKLQRRQLRKLLKARRTAGLRIRHQAKLDREDDRC